VSIANAPEVSGQRSEVSGVGLVAHARRSVSELERQKQQTRSLKMELAAQRARLADFFYGLSEPEAAT
jgi:hypothetical protein